MILSPYLKSIADPKRSLTLPALPRSVLGWVLSSATSVFASEPSVLRLTGDIVVIGDLHGHLPDLPQV
jgi:hypothetical protein